MGHPVLPELFILIVGQNLLVVTNLLQQSLELIQVEGGVEEVRLPKLGGKERVNLERHQAVDHEDYLGDEVNGLLSVVSDSELGSKHCLLHVELFNLQ